MPDLRALAKQAQLIPMARPAVRAAIKVYKKLKKKSAVAAAQKPLDAAGSLIEAISNGASLSESVVDMVRRGRSTAARIKTRAFVQRLVDDPATEAVGSLGLAVFLSGDELYESAYHYFVQAGIPLAIKLAPYEYFDSECYHDPKKGINDLTSFLAESRHTVAPNQMMEFLEVLAKYGALDALRTEVAELRGDSARSDELTDDNRRQLEWYHTHLNRNEPAPKSIPGAVNFAVMDYKLLDRARTSSNRGDYVQTLAALSNLLRFKDISFVGDDPLAPYLNKLKKSVHKDRQISGTPVAVQPVPVDRDWSHGREYPENTWLINNGWFMHRTFKGEVDFPYPKNIKPIMVSFHIQDPDVLTDTTVKELKRIEPIGCRDWTTLYRLRDFGIKAFFSGCVTTTVGQILPPASGTSEPKLALVETYLNNLKYTTWKVDKFIQVGDYVRDFSLVEGIEDARQMLTEYVPYKQIVTSRLHCYLPARSMGFPVDFVPTNRADVRFEGLLDLDEDAFNAIRHGIEDKLETILRVILSGASEKKVRATWAEICADDVAAAERYASTYAPAPRSAINLPSVLSEFEESRVVYAPNKRGKNAVDIALALDQNLEDEITVVLQSVLDNTTREINAHILTRGLDENFHAKLRHLFPSMNFTFYNFDEVHYGDEIALLSHISVSTMDRLFLPSLLKELDKVVYLDIDILVQGDVGYLYDIDLGDNVCAGKRTRLRTWANMIRPITRATLKFEPETAWEIRRRLHDLGKMTSRTFNAGILVLNLTKMRTEKFTEEHLYLVEQCMLNDQDVINIYSRDRVHELPMEWNTVPSQDFVAEPKIIHWAGPAKPWLKQYVLFKDRYDAVKARVDARL
ncbi:MAG: hypothetical protein RLZZ319_389 [Actinomycetota bacterium]